MGIFGDIVGKGKGAAAPINPPSKAAEKVAKQSRPAETPRPAMPPQHEAPADEGGSDRAPWYVDPCRACGKNKVPGFNSKMQPCRICAGRSEAAGGPVPAQYVIETLEDGSVIWERIDGEDVGSAEVIDEPKASERQEDAPDEPEDGASEEEEETPEEPSGKGKRKTKDTEKSKGGRPRAGVTMLIDCMTIVGHRDVITIDEILQRNGLVIAQENGFGNYYEMEAFRRRDLLCRRAEDIVKELGSAVVVSIGPSPDAKALLEAMSPFVPRIYVGKSI